MYSYETGRPFGIRLEEHKKEIESIQGGDWECTRKRLRVYKEEIENIQ